ncbi:MAG: 50S ribosomal protein L15 [Patescibacteria group bacterium]
MSLLNLSSKLGRKHKKTLGRGNGSGHGTYSGKGIKGQKARNGGTLRPGFEGGQTPMLRKMPKLKGFKNPNYMTYQVVNVGKLNIFEENAKITRETLFEKKLIPKKNKPVKLLGDGELTKTFEITVDKASKEAIKKIAAAKGKLTLLSPAIDKTEK